MAFGVYVRSTEVGESRTWSRASKQYVGRNGKPVWKGLRFETETEAREYGEMLTKMYANLLYKIKEVK